jgi:hypothetical protein
MIIQQTRTFERTVKKLHAQQKQDLDVAIRKIAKQPDIGELKKGDLAGVRVYNGSSRLKFLQATEMKI